MVSQSSDLVMSRLLLNGGQGVAIVNQIFQSVFCDGFFGDGSEDRFEKVPAVFEGVA